MSIFHDTESTYKKLAMTVSIAYAHKLMVKRSLEHNRKVARLENMQERVQEFMKKKKRKSHFIYILRNAFPATFHNEERMGVRFSHWLPLKAIVEETTFLHLRTARGI